MGTSLYSGSERYHSKARKTTPRFSSVLSHNLQMRRYRNQKESTSEVETTDPPARPAPVSGVKPAPTRFKVQDSVYNKKSTHNEFSVEVEFQKYISGSMSSEETSILRFWEVRYD
jgi:hypothetical protein